MTISHSSGNFLCQILLQIVRRPVHPLHLSEYSVIIGIGEIHLHLLFGKWASVERLFKWIVEVHVAVQHKSIRTENAWEMSLYEVPSLKIICGGKTSGLMFFNVKRNKTKLNTGKTQCCPFILKPFPEGYGVESHLGLYSWSPKISN